MILRIVAAVAVALAIPAAIAGELTTARVVGVTDGDTITLLDHEKRQIKVRMAGIDAPERGQPFGSKSKQALSDLVFGKTVEVDDQGEDKYDRTIARILVDGVDVNREMVARGMAWQYVKYDQSAALRAAEKSAREAKLGLWADKGPIPPWEWRRMSKDERDKVRASGTAETAK